MFFVMSLVLVLETLRLADGVSLVNKFTHKDSKVFKVSLKNQFD